MGVFVDHLRDMRGGVRGPLEVVSAPLKRFSSRTHGKSRRNEASGNRPGRSSCLERRKHSGVSNRAAGAEWRGYEERLTENRGYLHGRFISFIRISDGLRHYRRRSSLSSFRSVCQTGYQSSNRCRFCSSSRFANGLGVFSDFFRDLRSGVRWPLGVVSTPPANREQDSKS